MKLSPPASSVSWGSCWWCSWAGHRSCQESQLELPSCGKLYGEAAQTRTQHSYWIGRQLRHMPHFKGVDDPTPEFIYLTSCTITLVIGR